jgi:hypothetical protein
MKHAAFFALLALLGGCTASVSDEENAGGASAAGGVSSGGASAGGSGAGTAGASRAVESEHATFATIGQIVQLKCGGSGCHTEREPTLAADANLYTTLTTFVTHKCGQRLLVKPGVPQESAFLLAQSGLCGAELPRMPLGCVDNCTPPEYLEGVRQWIERGAPQQ